MLPIIGRNVFYLPVGRPSGSYNNSALVQYVLCHQRKSTAASGVLQYTRIFAYQGTGRGRFVKHLNIFLCFVNRADSLA